MDFAVIKIAGKQHLVKVGGILEINANLGKVGDSITIPDVLLQKIGDEITVGEPFITESVVKSEVTFSGKGTKLTIRKFKSKVRYRRTIGFRPLLTKIKIVSIDKGSPKKSDKINQPKRTK